MDNGYRQAYSSTVRVACENVAEVVPPLGYPSDPRIAPEADSRLGSEQDIIWRNTNVKLSPMYSTSLVK